MKKYVWIIILGFPQAHAQEFPGSYFQNRCYFQPFSGLGTRSYNQERFELEPVWFESALALPFYAELGNKKTILGAFQSLKLRMYKEPSFPVKTPDYRIQGFVQHRFFYRDSSDLSWFCRAQHHSNGQKDPLYDTLQVLNTRSGSFAVNSLLAGVLLRNTRKEHNIRSLMVYYERVFFQFSERGMSGFYYEQALNASLMLALSSRGLIETGVGLMHHHQGKMRMKAETVLYWSPVPASDMHFFVRLYYGPDEYNSRYCYQRFSVNAGITCSVQPVKLW